MWDGMILVIDGQTIDVSGGGLPERTVAVKPLSRTEYNALTDEEKQADVAYAITDDPPVSGSSWEVYSEKEVWVGTWIDGKPLYRKTFKCVIGSVNKWTSYDSIDNLDTLVKCTGFFTIGVVSYIAPSPVLYLGANVVDGVKKFSMDPTGPSLPNNEITVTAEYTKTTDTGGAR